MQFSYDWFVKILISFYHPHMFSLWEQVFYLVFEMMLFSVFQVAIKIIDKTQLNPSSLQKVGYIWMTIKTENRRYWV
jgi:hypothetical protein